MSEQYARLEPITEKGEELLEVDEGVVHECENPTWTKTSLVTENEGFDYVKCDECGIQAKRYGMGSRFEIIGFDVK
jgi:hypothetical protein